MLKLFLKYFCIISKLLDNNEISLIKLSITAIGAVVIGYIIITIFFMVLWYPVIIITFYIV